MKAFFQNRGFRLVDLLIIVAMIGLLASAFQPSKQSILPSPIASAEAAVPNVASGGAQVVYIPFHLSGAISATAAGIVKFNMPMACDLIGASASSRAIVGTTNTVDVLLGGVSVLSAPITIAAAGTVTEGTIATSAIPDEGVITVTVTIAGTSLTDTTVFLTCVRK